MRTLIQAFKTKELRNKILFTLGIIIIYRVGSFVPTPGVDYTVVQQCVGKMSSTSENFIGLVNLFSGGAMLQLSIFALGVMPYITASIVIQLLRVVIPRFEALHKEGQSDHRSGGAAVHHHSGDRTLRCVVQLPVLPGRA